MPPGPPPAGASFFSSGISETIASVVRSRDAMFLDSRNKAWLTVVQPVPRPFQH
jgi:hypothetical protein